MSTDELHIFSDYFLNEVLSSSDHDDAGEFRIDAFTRIAGEYLIDSGEIDGISVCYYKARGIRLNGYNVSYDNDCVDLFVSIFNQSTPPAAIVKSLCDSAFKQAETAFDKALSGFHDRLEEASEAYDMFQHIYSIRDQISKCRIYLLTDGLAPKVNPYHGTVKGIGVSCDIWDMERIFRFATSGKSFEPIEIDFQRDYGGPLNCLQLNSDASDYAAYLTAIPGSVVSKIYGDYGPRLLERNVRAFLQTRGKVNKGIRKTILSEPHRFFAYNNGLTATADWMDLDSQGRICRVRNLQIVNGAQTTASLYHAATKDKADLSAIHVQVKLSVISEDRLEEVVPLISRFANSQNKVSDADFFANDPYHIRIEELSRTVWTPVSGLNARATRWFYERARGQYNDAKTKELTPARKKKFEAQFPSRQKFTKTDLAKYENSWMQLPHLVSLGAQKNFNEFSLRLRERGTVDLDVSYFERLVAKAILFRRADKIVRDENFGGYKANIVTYTVAWLSHHTAQKLDLDAIWRQQDISEDLQQALRLICRAVHQSIIRPPDGKNVTEWCKASACWDRVKALKIPVDNVLSGCLPLGGGVEDVPHRGVEEPNAAERELIQRVHSIPAETWFELARWAKETGNLHPWQRSLAFSIGRRVSGSSIVSRKQATQGVKILNEAEQLGFAVPSGVG